MRFLSGIEIKKLVCVFVFFSELSLVAGRSECVPTAELIWLLEEQNQTKETNSSSALN